MDENKVEVWVSLSLGFQRVHFLMHRSLLITVCSRDARNRSAISVSSKSPSGARVLAMGFNSLQPISLIVAH
ncbi:hypothetical protein F2Q70_00029589 [Brassica cretica]|uniref:Uncharacterized protein n=1 Tax=Brassica cretica TaxID=69181 RepID=A0A8S9FHW7_BRACR|nr:hypothetical protein F2Q70_00029589 [Brassica cretica]